MLHSVSDKAFLTHIRKSFYFLGGAPLLPSLTEAVNSDLALSSSSTQSSNSTLTALGHLGASKAPPAANTVPSVIQDGSETQRPRFGIPGH